MEPSQIPTYLGRTTSKSKAKNRHGPPTTRPPNQKSAATHIQILLCDSFLEKTNFSLLLSFRDQIGTCRANRNFLQVFDKCRENTPKKNIAGKMVMILEI